MAFTELFTAVVLVEIMTQLLNLVFVLTPAADLASYCTKVTNSVANGGIHLLKDEFICQQDKLSAKRMTKNQ